MDVTTQAIARRIELIADAILSSTRRWSEDVPLVFAFADLVTLLLDDAVDLELRTVAGGKSFRSFLATPSGPPHRSQCVAAPNASLEVHLHPQATATGDLAGSAHTLELLVQELEPRAGQGPGSLWERLASGIGELANRDRITPIEITRDDPDPNELELARAIWLATTQRARDTLSAQRIDFRLVTRLSVETGWRLYAYRPRGSDPKADPTCPTDLEPDLHDLAARTLTTGVAQWAHGDLGSWLGVPATALGVSWMAVLLHAANDTCWRDFFWWYRDGDAMVTIRERAQQSLATSMLDRLSLGLANAREQAHPDATIDAVNRAWHCLPRILPMGRPRLSPSAASGSGDSRFQIGGRDCYIEFGDEGRETAPFFHAGRQLPSRTQESWSRIDPPTFQAAFVAPGLDLVRQDQELTELLRLEEERQIREAGGLIIAHDLKTLIDLMVLRGIRAAQEAVEADRPRAQALAALRASYASADRLMQDLRTYLDGFREAEGLRADLERGATDRLQSLHPDSLTEFADPARYGLTGMRTDRATFSLHGDDALDGHLRSLTGDGTDLPSFSLHVDDALDGHLRIGRMMLGTMLRMLVRNALEAIQRVGKPLSTAEIRIAFRHAESSHRNTCLVSVWNSGTVMPKNVIARAGLQHFAGGLSRSNSGLGFFLLEKILRFLQAPRHGDRSIILRNTAEPPGAEACFLLARVAL